MPWLQEEAVKKLVGSDWIEKYSWCMRQESQVLALSPFLMSSVIITSCHCFWDFTICGSKTRHTNSDLMLMS
jgi:hypothetical protein